MTERFGTWNFIRPDWRIVTNGKKFMIQCCWGINEWKGFEFTTTNISGEFDDYLGAKKIFDHLVELYGCVYDVLEDQEKKKLLDDDIGWDDPIVVTEL